MFVRITGEEIINTDNIVNVVFVHKTDDVIVYTNDVECSSTAVWKEYVPRLLAALSIENGKRGCGNNDFLTPAEVERDC